MRKINTFWNWFQDNNQTIKNLFNETPNNQKQICYWLNKQLGYYCKELDFMIVLPKKENQKAELIITAKGNPEYFSQVIKLIDKAPVLRYWKFTAFIQPTENRQNNRWFRRAIHIPGNNHKNQPNKIFAISL
jgi:hypothetical protein